MPFDPPFSRNFTAESIRQHAPAQSGVYGLSDASGWIHIGESDNIQHTLLRRFYQAAAPAADRRPSGFAFEICELAQRAARQNRLILEYASYTTRRGK